MCRYDPITKSERRCPSYLDKASYNAKRRARYNTKKNGNAFTKSVQETPKNQSLMNSSTFNPHSVQIFKQKYLLESDSFVKADKDELYKVSDETEYNEALNVYSQPCSGALVEDGYVPNIKISGIIDATNLQKDSYENFGLSKMEFLGEEVIASLPGEVDSDEMLGTNLNLSTLELSELTPEENASVRFFTSNEYKWFSSFIAKKVYDQPEELEKIFPSKNPIPEESFFTPSTLNPIYRFGGEIEARNLKAVKEITTALDSALSKGPKLQRKVYRGVKTKSSVVKGLIGNFDSAAEWCESGSALGQEVVFNGYQSASMSSKIADGYTSTDGGVVFEILTPEGINITSKSQYAKEHEVLLPRNARYKIVGVQNRVNPNKDVPGVENTLVQLVAINSKGEILDGTNSDPVIPIDFPNRSDS